MSKLIITWILASSFGWAVSYTTISDTLLKADGTPMAGEIVVSWSTFQASDGTTVVGGTKRIRVLNGVLSTSLVSGAVYQAVYYEAGRGVARELWNVPASASPVRVADMRTILYSDSSAAAIQGVPVDPAPPAPDAVLMFDQVSGRWTARGIPSCTTCVTSDQNYSDPPWLNSIAWSKVINPPVTFPPAPHTHPQADITNLVTDLAAKITTPSTAGGNGLYLRRTSDNSGWELASAASAWGSITGTLSNQADLASALNAKEPSISTGTTSQYLRGDKSWQELDAAAVGLGNVANYGIASQAEAEAGTANNKYMTPLRVAQAIAVLGGSGGSGSPTYPGSLTLPTIDAGRVGCGSYSATGATVGTPLSVGITGLPSGLTLPVAEVRTADYVQVCVLNNSLSPVASDTYSAVAVVRTSLTGANYSGSVTLPAIAPGRVGCGTYSATGVVANAALSVAVSGLPSTLVLPTAHAAAADVITVCVLNDGLSSFAGDTYSVTAALNGGAVGSGGGGTWGSITGTLADQTDLANALNGKVGTSRTISTATYSGLAGGGDLTANRALSLTSCAEGQILKRTALGWECGTDESGGGGALPSQSGHAGKVLRTDGSAAYWVSLLAGSGLSRTDVTESITLSVDSTQLPYLALNNAFLGNNQFAGTLANVPSATQTLSAGTAIDASANSTVQITSSEAVTLTATPTISAGVNGQRLTLLNVGSYTISMQDRGALTGSGLCLRGAAQLNFATAHAVDFIYSSALTCWVEIGR